MPYSVGLVFRDGKPLVYASGDFPKSQRRAMAMADYAGFRARQARARAAGRFIGIGIANYVEGTGLGPFEGVTVRILPSGKVAVATGATTQGQGTPTMLAQIVADRLGCAMADILVTAGDTNAISQGVGAFASRQAINAGNSAMMAGDTVKAQVVALAARTLGVPEAEIDVEDGHAHRPRRQQADPELRGACAPRPGDARVFVRGRSDAGSRTHRLFHSAPSFLLQRHPRGRGRGRSARPAA